jgi:hypothetical protein
MGDNSQHIITCECLSKVNLALSDICTFRYMLPTEVLHVSVHYLQFTSNFLQYVLELQDWKSVAEKEEGGKGYRKN